MVGRIIVASFSEPPPKIKNYRKKDLVINAIFLT